MKKTFTLCAGLALALGASAQFSDDFENYSPGDYIGVVSPTWTTWSGTVGGSEDVQVTTNDAASGSQSIYFSSNSANGGPQDVVLPFGQVMNTGQFSMEMNFKVEPGKAAYMNLQANATIGQTWALDFNFDDAGNLSLQNQQGVFLTTTYPVDTWFNLKIDVDFNVNDWELFIDTVSQGSFSNPENQVASLDIYPINQGSGNASGFYVDDVMWNYTPYNLPPLNAGVTLVADINGLAGQSKTPEVEIKNLGTSAISSFDLSVDYNGNVINQTVSGLNLASLATTTVTLNQSISLVAGANPMTVTVSNVNGMGQDGDPNDDVKTISVDPIVPALNKMVVGEEGTGTWCGWCPRGAVAMDHMAEEYEGFFQGIAVHNGDPMVVASYDTWMGTQISGYPSGLIDRKAVLDPSGFESEFLKEITTLPSAVLTPSISYDGVDEELTATVDVDFTQNVSGNWKVYLVFIEDDVTGSGSTWAQANYFAGGAQGPMGGYENLPNPVPASQMVYDDVARTYVTQSDDGSTLPTSITSGQNFTFNFTVDVQASWALENMTAVAILINDDNEIDNAGTKGVAGTPGLSSETESNFEFNLYPNPSVSGTSMIQTTVQSQEVEITVRNLNGQVLFGRNYGTVSGSLEFPINTQNLDAGIYLVEMRMGNEFRTEKLIVQ